MMNPVMHYLKVTTLIKQTFTNTAVALLALGCFIAGVSLPSTAQQETTISQSSGLNTTTPQTNGKLALKELQAFVNAFTQIRNTYVEEVDDKTLLENAIKGMLGELDPHSNYLPPQTFESLQVSATGEFGGLGLEVGMEDGFVKVISPIDDTPAQKAGVESGDLIVKIDNKPIKGLSLNEAVKLMRGKVNTDIDLTIIRKDVPQPLEFTLTRDVISVTSVRHRFVEEDYLLLRVAQFQGNTGDNLRKALKKASDEKDIHGLVLDLRNNPGGVLQAAVEVVDTFIDKGLIVYTEGRIKQSATTFSATNEYPTNDLPLVVLINGGSASASEIVAGALQDHKRAIVLGVTSFGKGSVQSVIPLSATHGMKLTTARYFTPKGRSIQAQGIVPDIIVERSKITKYDALARISESDLHGHLQNTNNKNSSKKNKPDNQKSETTENLISNDAQLHEALTLLKGLYILSQRDTPKSEIKSNES